MYFPKELSQKARALIQVEELNAKRDLEQARAEAEWSQFGPGEELEKHLRIYILRIFRVCARQLCGLGSQNLLPVEKIRSTADEFLRRLTIEAFYDQGHDRTGRKLHVPVGNAGTLRSEICRKYQKSIQWYQFEEDLLVIAEMQGQGDTQSGDRISIVGRLPYDAISRIGVAMEAFCATNRPILEQEATEGNTEEEASVRQFFRDLPTHVFNAIAKECLEVSDSVQEFETALRFNITRFVRYYLDQAQVPSEGINEVLERAASEYLASAAACASARGDEGVGKGNGASAQTSIEPVSDGARAPVPEYSKRDPGPTEQAKKLTQLLSSPRVRTDCRKAMATLSDELHKTWKRVLPGIARLPCGSCEEFFEPFVQFGVALYNAQARELLETSPSGDYYLHSLNFDLKTLVCNQIVRYRERPIRTFQDALEAEKRGELPDEWSVRMGESWRQFDHPRHGDLSARVTRDFIDALYEEPGRFDKLFGRVHNAISRRTTHWWAAHAEHEEALASRSAAKTHEEAGVPTANDVDTDTQSPGAGPEAEPQGEDVDPELMRARQKEASDLDARSVRFRDRNPPEAVRQEELLNDAREYIATNLQQTINEWSLLPSILEVEAAWISTKDRLVLKTWEEFRPGHRNFSVCRLDFREFKKAVWEEGRSFPGDLSLEEQVAEAIEEIAERKRSADPPVEIRSPESAPATDTTTFVTPKLDTDRIRKWMSDEGHDIPTLAAQLKKSERAITSMLNGGNYHGRKLIAKLANLMQCDVSDLYLD